MTTPQEKEQLYFPIHINTHWFLLVVVNKGVSSSNSTSIRAPKLEILQLDSLGDSGSGPAGRVQEFLLHRCAYEQECDVNDIRGFFEDVPVCMVKTPQQHTYDDCGVFTLLYAELSLNEKFHEQELANLV